MRKLLLPVVLGLSLVTGCSVAVTAKTQTRYTKDITAQSSKADWNGTSTITGTPESAAAIIGPSVVTIEVTGQESSAFGENLFPATSGCRQRPPAETSVPWQSVRVEATFTPS